MELNVNVQNTEYNVNFILRSNPRRTIFNSAPMIQLNKKSYNYTEIILFTVLNLCVRILKVFYIEMHEYTVHFLSRLRSKDSSSTIP
jgi:hypothetical protein